MLASARRSGQYALVAAEDLADLPETVRLAARVLDNGEVMWPAEQAASAIDALADCRRVVLGLDVRDYAPDGSFFEIAWSSFRPSGDDDVANGHRAALDAMESRPIPGNWVLVTWL